MFAILLLLAAGVQHLEVYTEPTCPPCQQLKADYSKSPDMFGGRDVRFLRARDGKQKGVRLVPTLILYEDGKEVKRVSGYGGEAAVERWLRK